MGRLAINDYHSQQWQWCLTFIISINGKFSWSTDSWIWWISGFINLIIHSRFLIFLSLLIVSVTICCNSSSISTSLSMALGFPGSTVVKNLPASERDLQTWVCLWGQKDPLEEGRATHSGIFACRIPWTEKPGVWQSTGSQRVGYDWRAHSRHYGRPTIVGLTCRHIVWTLTFSKLQRAI